MQVEMTRQKPTTSWVWLHWLLILAIALGIGFRFLHLDRKIVGHDEAYNSLRAAGYSDRAMDAELFQNKFFAPADLRKFQTIRPGSTANDTIRSLSTEDPQHPPLYFLMARAWMQSFGGSIFAARLLPALLSLLSLPLMYLLAVELFASRLVALLATALVALSPFDVLFAQTARQYELLATLVIASTLFLVRGLRRENWQDWGLYALSVTLGLYTHLFFALTVVANGFCVVLLYFCGMGSKPPSWLEERWREERWREDLGCLKDLPVSESSEPSSRSERWRWLLSFAIAITLALVFYLPWLTVLLNRQQVDLSRVTVGMGYLLTQWLLGFTSLFCNLEFGFENPLNLWIRVPFLLLILTAIVIVYQKAPRLSWMITLKTIFVPFLLLALPDLIMGGRRSAVSHDLIFSYVGVQLAVAYLFAVGLSSAKRQVWRWLLAIVLTIGILSNSQNAMAETGRNQGGSSTNAEVAQILNAEAAPVVVSDVGDDSSSLGDLISLSFRLKDTVRLYLTAQPPNLDPIATEPNVLLFRPSSKIRLALAARGWGMQEIAPPKPSQPQPSQQETAPQTSLWRLQR